jgi:hypothetical protein
VLPRVALASNSPSIDVPVDVSVKVIVVVDVYVAVLPIAVAPVVVGPYASQDKSRSKSQPHAGVVPRIGVRIIGIGRRRSSVNHLGVI